MYAIESWDETAREACLLVIHYRSHMMSIVTICLRARRLAHNYCATLRRNQVNPQTSLGRKIHYGPVEYSPDAEYTARVELIDMNRVALTALCSARAPPYHSTADRQHSHVSAAATGQC